jgi:hypothetical protein
MGKKKVSLVIPVERIQSCRTPGDGRVRKRGKQQIYLMDSERKMFYANWEEGGSVGLVLFFVNHVHVNGNSDRGL